jgi:hypothetical protein
MEEIYSRTIFESLSVIGQCPVNMNIPTSEIMTLQKSPQTQNSNFSKKTAILVKIGIFMNTGVPNRSALVIFQANSACPLAVRKQNVSFLKSDWTKLI